MKLSLQDYKNIGCQNAELYFEWVNYYSIVFKVNTVPRILAFLPNLLHESGNFKYVEEIASGDAYESRTDLGNTLAVDGDGKKFKGRGLGQVTGTKNYRAFTNFANSLGIQIDFVKFPEKLKEPQYAVLSAFWFWQVNNLAGYADKGEFREVCSIWNTGKPNSITINGYADRVKKYDKVITWLVKLVA